MNHIKLTFLFLIFLLLICLVACTIQLNWIFKFTYFQ
jgi:hypothetical protein